MEDELQRFARAFVDWYYGKFNTNKEEVLGLYNESSLVTFQEKQYSGTNQMTNKLWIEETITSPYLIQMTKTPSPFFTIQPSIGNTVLISVQGNCRMTPEEAEEIGFFEIFLVAQVEGGGFVILNQIFSTASV